MRFHLDMPDFRRKATVLVLFQLTTLHAEPDADVCCLFSVNVDLKTEWLLNIYIQGYFLYMRCPKYVSIIFM